MGLLNTMETILAVMEERSEVHAALEPVILQAIHHIYTNSIMEFYEEAMSLSCDLTSKRISPDMWKMLEVMYTVFQRDGFDYFSDMMPALHNYVTVDTATFLSSLAVVGSSPYTESPTAAAAIAARISLEGRVTVSDLRSTVTSGPESAAAWFMRNLRETASTSSTFEYSGMADAPPSSFPTSVGPTSFAMENIPFR